MRNKKFAFETYKSFRKDKEWHASDADMWAVAIAYNDALLVVEELVSDLKFALERNPYPGEQKRLVAIAVELFPDAGVKFEPGRRRVMLREEKLWRKIFEIGDVSFLDKIYFPEADGDWDIIEIEEKLLLLVRADNTILAAEIPKSLKMKATGKVYAAVKQTLQQRGWEWIRRRNEGEREVVVFPPRSG